MKKVIVGTALALLGISLPAVATTSNKFQIRGQMADAYFYKSDDCNYTSFGVFASDSVSKSQPGAPTAQKGAYIYYSQYNWCTGEGSYGDGFANEVEFSSNNSLNSATLNGTFSLNDYSAGTTKTVDVALTWTGSGDIFRGNSHSHYQSSAFTSNYRYKGSYREAQVSGSVTLDGQSLLSDLSSSASLSSSNSGSVEVIRK
jgi:hypothetical protein